MRPPPCLILPLAVLLLGAETNAPFTNWPQFVAYLIAVFAGVTWLWKFVREGKKPNGNAQVIAAIATMTAVTTRIEKTLDTLTTQGIAATAAMTGVTLALTRLVDRLENIPTKLELSQAAERNRHDVR